MMLRPRGEAHCCQGFSAVVDVVDDDVVSHPTHVVVTFLPDIELTISFIHFDYLKMFVTLIKTTSMS